MIHLSISGWELIDLLIYTYTPACLSLPVIPGEARDINIWNTIWKPVAGENGFYWSSEEDRLTEQAGMQSLAI